MLQRLLVLACFFLSGATGLVYEVLWTRLLGATIGNTHFSITLVVSVFMGGLALGSYAGGRRADRSANPLRLYGILVLLIGLSCLLIPPLVEAARPIFAWLYPPYDGDPEAGPLLAVRILVCALLLIVPTSFMGATLPVLSRHFARSLGRVGGTVGALYALNTLGAVVGALFTGFIGIHRLGLWGTNLLAVGIDVAIGLAVLAAARKAASAPAAPREPEPARALPREPAAAPAAGAGAPSAMEGARAASVRLAVLAFALSGFANMLLQIAWTKAIVLTIGNSTYAFSLIVSLFILGIALGGGIVSSFVDRLRNPPLALGALILLTGLSVAATIPLLGYFPILGARLFGSIEEPRYETLLLLHVLLVAAVILPSTVLMGTVFPIVGKIRTLSIASVGSAIGGAYFWNTVGSILGTLAAGFVFIPLFGRVYDTLYLGAGVSLLVGFVLVLLSLPRPDLRLAVSAAFAALVLLPQLMFLPHGVLGSKNPYWHPAIMSQGAYVSSTFRHAYRDAEGRVIPRREYVEDVLRVNTVLSYHEGIHAPVAVVRSPTGAVAMRISGKVEASLAPSGGYNNDLPHQILAGHLPMILHPAPREVLTLGLGGGVTLGTLTLYPVDSIDSLEISPEVIAAAREHFAEANRGALDDVRVRNVIGDGRNHLEYTPRRYDVITSVPSNPWIAGIGNLFTVEFFATCRERLREGGIVCNWIHKVNMRADDFRTVVRTFLEVFDEHAQLWDLGYDCLLIGSPAPLRLDGERLARLLEGPEVAKDLGGLGITDPAMLFRHYKLDTAGMRDFAGGAGGGPLNTDTYPVLEHSCPFGLYGHALDAFRALVAAGHSPLAGAAWTSGLEPAARDRAAALQAAFHGYLKAFIREHELTEALAALKARGEDIQGRPDILELALGISDDLYEVAAAIRRAGGDPWLAGVAWNLSRKAITVPEQETFGATLAVWFLRLVKEWMDDPGKRARRDAYIEKALALAGEDPDVALLAADYSVRATGNRAAAIAVLAEALARFPTDLRLSPLLARYHYETGILHQDALEFDAAQAEYQKALEHDPGHDAARARLEDLERRRAGGE
jgi:spermidine synthase